MHFAQAVAQCSTRSPPSFARLNVLLRCFETFASPSPSQLVCTIIYGCGAVVVVIRLLHSHVSARQCRQWQLLLDYYLKDVGGSTLALSYHHHSRKQKAYYSYPIKPNLCHRVASTSTFSLNKKHETSGSVRYLILSRGLLNPPRLFMYCLHVRVFLTLAEPSWFPSTC